MTGIDVLAMTVLGLALAVSFAFLTAAGVSLRRFSIPSCFFIFYVILAYIGLVPLYFRWDYGMSLGIVDRPTILRLLLYSSASIVLVCSGMACGRHFLGLRAERVHNERAIGSTGSQRGVLLALLIVCVVVLIAYLRTVPDIALFAALDGDIMAAARARSDMGNAYQGAHWRYHLFFRTLLNYCVLAFFADYLVKRGIGSLLVFIVSLAVAAVAATMAIEKGPLLSLFLMLYLTYVLHKGGAYWQPAAKYVVPLGIVVAAWMFVQFMGATDLWTAMQFLYIRVSTGQIAPAYFYLTIFPEHIPYLWGASFPNPSGLLPFEQFELTREVAHFIWEHHSTMGIVGSAPTVFWAEMYANFGPPAILASSFVVGVALMAVAHVLAEKALSPPVAAATVALAMHYRTLTATSLSNYFIDVTLVAIAVVTWLALMCSRRRVSRAGRATIVGHGARRIHHSAGSGGLRTFRLGGVARSRPKTDRPLWSRER